MVSDLRYTTGGNSGNAIRTNEIMNFFDWLKIVLLMSVILLALTVILHQKIQNAPKKKVEVEYRLMNINF
jgi:hypothetical protein